MTRVLPCSGICTTPGRQAAAPEPMSAAPAAWCVQTGNAEVVVAVIDTGVDYNHPDLQANIWINPGEDHAPLGEIGPEDFDAVDDDGNGQVDDICGYDFINDDRDPTDDHGHGSHCAGVIGAVGDNQVGLAGVCWDVKIMPLKFLDAGGSGYISDAISCIEYATENGAQVMNNSWGGGGYSQAMYDAIAAAGQAGVLFVAAAGNDGISNDVYPHYPSNYELPNVIAVMATDWHDAQASYSNYGALAVDLAAPGGDLGGEVYSCWKAQGYHYARGTSMAAPHVAGACALIWSGNSFLTHAEVKDIILQTVDPLDTLIGKCVAEGRLALDNALAQGGGAWLDVAPISGTVAPGDAAFVAVTIDGAGPLGSYAGEITISSNDPYPEQTGVAVTMTVVPADYFTEWFDSENNDLSGLCLTFEPTADANDYRMCVGWADDWPVEPNDGIPIVLADDDYAEVQLTDAEVPFYGSRYDRVYVGSNGYISFISGDTARAESPEAHFWLPRIAGLFDDLDPAAGGTVWQQQLADRLVVTFENVPEYGSTNANSFQFELFFDGAIRLTLLDIAASDGLVGLSDGSGAPSIFQSSDLSEYEFCLGSGAVTGAGAVAMADFALLGRFWAGSRLRAGQR